MKKMFLYLLLIIATVGIANFFMSSLEIKNFDLLVANDYKMFDKEIFDQESKLFTFNLKQVLSEKINEYREFNIINKLFSGFLYYDLVVVNSAKINFTSEIKNLSGPIGGFLFEDTQLIDNLQCYIDNNEISVGKKQERIIIKNSKLEEIIKKIEKGYCELGVKNMSSIFPAGTEGGEIRIDKSVVANLKLNIFSKILILLSAFFSVISLSVLLKEGIEIIRNGPRYFYR